MRVVGFKQMVFDSFLRYIYRNLPLSSPVKQRLKEIYLGWTPIWKGFDKTAFKLDINREPSAAVTASAQQYDAHSASVLVIDERIPTPDQDSGSVRMSAILRLLQEMEFKITFVSDSQHYLPGYRKALEKQGIQVLQGFDAARSHLAKAGGKYHFAFLSRPEIAFRYLPYVRAYALYSKVIYDTVDLHWVRFEREMQITENQALLEVITNFRRLELFNTACADLTLAITHEEKNRLLLEEPDAEVAILPNIHEIHLPKTLFAQRAGLLFVGGFWHQPNEDAVIFFVKRILPLIVKRIPSLVFYIIGSHMPPSVKALRSTNVQPLGFVADLAPYFESCRIFVAPLRYGAGMKGKVGQSMSYGLPVVTSTIGAEGMGLMHEKHLLIADDAGAFAAAVVRLYNDEPLWRKLSSEGLSHLEDTYSYNSARKRMSSIFGRVQELGNTSSASVSIAS